MKKIQLGVLGLSTNPQGSEYALVLFELNGERKLPILIGGSEAQAIAIKLENQTLLRPSTHDLLFSILGEFGMSVNEVVIDKLEEDRFYAKIICEYSGIVRQIDSRPSDAVAIALRAYAPIYVLESVLDVAGISHESKSKKIEGDDIVSSENEIDDKQLFDDSLIKLKVKLKEAVDKEDYEKAAMLRDEIKNLSTGKKL